MISKYKTNFSRTKCREIAAINRLMLEIPDVHLIVLTNVATILSADYDGAMRIQELVQEIMHPNKGRDYNAKISLNALYGKTAPRQYPTSQPCPYCDSRYCGAGNNPCPAM